MSNTGINKSKGAPWVVVIFLLILFWPVGLLLLWNKINSDKSAVLKKSKSLAVAGWIMLTFGIFYVISLQTGSVITSDESSSAGGIIFAILSFIGGGLALIINAKKMKIKGEKYKKYISTVINQQMTSIDNIAAALRVNYDTAVIDLQNMIDLGYFENGYIDVGKREIILQNRQPEFYTSSPAQSESAPKSRVVKCQGCGANNTVVGNAVHECEYCGFPLS